MSDGIAFHQCCDLETMVSRLESTRVHFAQGSVSVSRPEGPGLGLGLKPKKGLDNSTGFQMGLKTDSAGTVSPCDEAWLTQWSSGSMPDCSARGPGIESRCGQLCLS